MTILEEDVSLAGTDKVTSQTRTEKHTLRECMDYVMTDYFEQLDGQEVVDLYEMVISEVEAPLMEAVMTYTRNNQTKASVALGLNRGTLRKKLKKYDML